MTQDAQPPLKIGFDFDGVILYNPARIIRPMMAYLKLKRVVKRHQLVFFVPKTKTQRSIWWLAHQSSLFPAPGLDQLKALVASGQVEAHLLTGRYPELAADVHRKLRLFGLADVFTQVHTMTTIQQPHLFKEAKIKELQLDLFVEDNYDIAAYLTGVVETQIYWLANVLDTKLVFAHKFASFKAIMEQIEQVLAHKERL